MQDHAPYPQHKIIYYNLELYCVYAYTWFLWTPTTRCYLQLSSVSCFTSILFFLFHSLTSWVALVASCYFFLNCKFNLILIWLNNGPCKVKTTSCFIPLYQCWKILSIKINKSLAHERSWLTSRLLASRPRIICAHAVSIIMTCDCILYPL